MKILVPSDFSKLSKVAAEWALQFACECGGEIVLCHVVHLEGPPMVQVALRQHVLEDLQIESATATCRQLMEELKKDKTSIQITCEVVAGFPLDETIVNLAQKHHVDIIVMGTKGASGLEKIIFGTNAIAVINKSPLPVVTVPEFGIYEGIKRVVFASLSKTPNLEKVILMARPFQARIDVLHIGLPAKNQPMLDEANERRAKERYGYTKIHFHTLFSEEVALGIGEFVAKEKANILAMAVHEQTLFEKLFSKSVSREIALRGKIPLLTWKE